MDSGRLGETRTDRQARALAKAQRSGAVISPDLDAADEDVFDLGLGLDAVQSGFFPSVTSEEPEVATSGIFHAVEVEPVSTGAEAPVVDSGDVPSPPEHPHDSAPAEAPRSWPERVLAGLLVANTIVVGAMLLAPDLFQWAPPPNEFESGRGSPPVSNARTIAVRPPVDGTAGGVPVALSETMPDYEAYESAQHWIGRGHYEKATRILNNYLIAETGLSALHSQAVHSSLAYCARSLGQPELAEKHAHSVENYRRLDASPEALWEEARQAQAEGRTVAMRQLYARLLLRQDSLGDWNGTDRIPTARTAVADSYRIESRLPAGRTKVVR